jgi:hypothetical protein
MSIRIEIRRGYAGRDGLSIDIGQRRTRHTAAKTQHGATRVHPASFAAGIQAKLKFPEKMDRLPRSVELALFRILQESLTNVHRYSGSPTVEVEIEVDAEIVSLAVRDAGRGIPEEVLEQFREAGAAGVGLAGMRERVTDSRWGVESPVEQQGHAAARHHSTTWWNFSTASTRISIVAQRMREQIIAAG